MRFAAVVLIAFVSFPVTALASSTVSRPAAPGTTTTTLKTTTTTTSSSRTVPPPPTPQPPPPPPPPPPSSTCPNAHDFIDPTYGGAVRQRVNPTGVQHNIYYWRSPFNADNTYMVGIQSDLDQTNWRVVLYDGNGCFLKELYTLAEYDWRVVWDRVNPDVFYTRNGSALYSYNVVTGQATLLKSFKGPFIIGASSRSLNQAGDRILVITSDGAFRTFHLPDMSAPRAFTAPLPTGCTTDWEDERYIGYKNYIAATCWSSDLTVQHTWIYDDTGVLLHDFNTRDLGHTDFSSTGQWAYFRMSGNGQPLQIHVVSIDGTNDHVLYSASQAKAQYVRNLHISWPHGVAGWFIASFFPFDLTQYPSLPTYASPLDEILQVHTDGTLKFLARTGTEMPDGFAYFWAETLGSPSSDGSRISFNSSCANNVKTLGCVNDGTIDQYLLFVK